MASQWRYVLYSIPGIGIGVRVYDHLGNLKSETIEETKEEAINFATELADKAGEAISEAIADFGAGLLDFVEWFMVAVLKAVENTYQYLGEKLAPFRVDTVKVVTMFLIWGLTAMVVFNMLKSSVAPIAN